MAVPQVLFVSDRQSDIDPIIEVLGRRGIPAMRAGSWVEAFSTLRAARGVRILAIDADSPSLLEAAAIAELSRLYPAVRTITLADDPTGVDDAGIVLHRSARPGWVAAQLLMFGEFA